MADFSRRTFLNHLGGGALSAWCLAQAGCDDGGGATALDGAVGDAGRAGDAGLADAFQPPDEVLRTDGPWWMRGNYGPVADEIEAMGLEIEGALPPTLNGLYVRNGSNPHAEDSSHWFTGDGMLHGVRLSNGRAEWYRNRYVRTSVFEERESGGPLPVIEDNGSNVSLVHHAGKLLTLGEVGLPYEIRPADLSTAGVYDFAGGLTTAMTAHPKIDPVTGEMFFFGYWFLPPYLTFHHVAADGQLTLSRRIEIPASVMMHDFALTERHVVFMDLPILFDLAAAMRGNSFPFQWSEANGARFGILPRAGATDAPVQWFDVDPCYVFHVMNAYEEAGKVVVEAVRHPKLWVDGPDDLASTPTLWRWTLDPVAGTVTEGAVDDHLVEFPMIDRRWTGRKQRYGFAVGGAGQTILDPGGGAVTNEVVRFDREGGVSTFDFGANAQVDEALFVPDGDGEGEGWLLSYVYDRARNATDLVVLDATDVTAGPVARVKLPRRVPFGFHATWVPA